MDADQRRFVVVNAVLVTAAINAVLNALPAWLAVRHLDHVALWTVPFAGGTGLYTDTLGTLIVLPFVTTILVTTGVWRARRNGLARLRLSERLRWLLALPRKRLPRAAAFSFLTVALLAAPAAIPLVLAAPDGAGRTGFVAYKTALGVVLGLVVTPLVAMRAMADRV